jgi:kynureninase
MSDDLKKARKLDAADKLKKFRSKFYFPKTPGGKDFLYFAGNSLGLQPKTAKAYIDQELKDWAKHGVEGHLKAKTPWLSYHENLTFSTAKLIGALPTEIVIMNTLSVNLHLMMVSFYRPDATRRKILVEAGAFPSDQYAVQSQIAFHGFDPKSDLVEVSPRAGEENIRLQDLLEAIEREGPSLALVLIGNVNYRTGQYFDIGEITKVAHKVGAKVGFDLAHGAGNLELSLHVDGPDFAAWCSYKYLNAGPGAISGVFVHERHARDFSLPRFAGWWGNNKSSRFEMRSDFECLPGAEGWQLSNPPIFQLAALRASMEIFEQTSMKNLRKKADGLTQFLEQILKEVPEVSIITPSVLAERGTQLSLRIKNRGKDFVQKLFKKGVICDFREPDIFRIAPVPLYTRYVDLVEFKRRLLECL